MSDETTEIIQKDGEVNPSDELEGATTPPSSEGQSDDGSKEVVRLFNNQNELLQEIKGIIQNRLEYDETKEKAFDKLYEEMRRQRELSDMIDRAIKPILTDLLLLHDTMSKFLTWADQHDMDIKMLQDHIKGLSDELIEVLYRQEVIPMDDVDMLNPKLHRATKTVEADTIDEDFRIIDVHRRGFFWRDKVLRPQEVVIKRFKAKD